jgi:hypothetical protein
VAKIIFKRLFNVGSFAAAPGTELKNHRQSMRSWEYGKTSTILRRQSYDHFRD